MQRCVVRLPQFAHSWSEAEGTSAAEAAWTGSITAVPSGSEEEDREAIVADANADRASGVFLLVGRGGGLVPKGVVFSSVISTAKW